MCFAGFRLAQEDAVPSLMGETDVWLPGVQFTTKPRALRVAESTSAVLPRQLLLALTVSIRNKGI